MTEFSKEFLRSALVLLRGFSGTAAAAEMLAGQAAAINRELRDFVLDQVPAYTATGNPEVLPELGAHAASHTDEVLRLLTGGPVRDFDFVRAHAVRRADQRFPLEATLHAYRCGHRVYARRLREATLAVAPTTEQARASSAAVADFAIEYTDAVSIVASASYLARTRLLADVAVDERAELLGILLDGYDESDGRVAGVLRRAGYLKQRQSFCVAVAQAVNPEEMLNPARARRMADSIDQTLAGAPGRRHVDLRDNRVVMVFSNVRRQSGWTAPRSSLAGRLAPELMRVGNAALIGLSNDVPSTSQIPRAYREALLALDMADAAKRVVAFTELPLRRLANHFARAQLQGVLPAWSGAFLAADRDGGGRMSQTVRAYAAADMNVLKAAQALGLHPNTVYARFRSIRDLCGLDARSFHDLNELLIVADLLR